MSGVVRGDGDGDAIGEQRGVEQQLAQPGLVVALAHVRGVPVSATSSARVASRDLAPRIRSAAAGNPAVRSSGGRPRLGCVTPRSLACGRGRPPRGAPSVATMAGHDRPRIAHRRARPGPILPTTEPVPAGPGPTDADPGERRLARPPSDRYRAAEAARRSPTIADRSRHDAGWRSSRSSRSSGRVAITILGGVLTLTGGLLAVAAILGWATAIALRFGAGDDDRRPPPGVARAGPRPRRRRARAARPVALRTDRGRRPAARRLPGRGLRPARPARGGRRRRRRLDRRPVTAGIRRLRFRRPTEADHPAVVAVVDEWWGGRRMRRHAPAPVVPAFRRDVVDRRESGEGRLVGFLVGFVSPDRPDEAYVHMIGDEPEPPKARPRSGAVRAILRGRRGRAAHDGSAAVDLAGQPDLGRGSTRRMGFRPDDGPGTQTLYGTRAYPDYDGEGEDRVLFSRDL